MTCLRIQFHAGTRPVGIAVDSLEQSFQTIARLLQACWPAQVHFFFGGDWAFADDHCPPDGQIYIHMTLKKSLGILLCEDPLHVYKRLLESVDYTSRESAFLARSLQSLLGTWNPSRRRHGLKDLNLGKNIPPGISWIHFEQWEHTRPATICDVLKAYFSGFSFPHNAVDILHRNLAQPWTHPNTQREVPRCSKIVIYRDVAKASGLKCVTDCMPTLCNFDLTADEIKLEFSMLGDFFQENVFADTRGGAQGSWWLQQLKYLKHFRQRPVLNRLGPRQVKVKPGTLKNPAGGIQFKKALQLQSQDVVVNGIVAAYHLKRHAIAAGHSLSLGTVGCERAWRNLQRSARNKARSNADEKSTRLLLVTRWMSEALKRLAAQADPDCRATSDRPGLSFDMLSSEMLVRAILGQSSFCEHAGHRASPLPGIDSEYLLQCL